MNIVKVWTAMLRTESQRGKICYEGVDHICKPPVAQVTTPQVFMVGTIVLLMVSESSYVNHEYVSLSEIGLLWAGFVFLSTESTIFLPSFVTCTEFILTSMI